jgi:aryl-alcohol dehydrogenase-like predicted oxidoreductase
MGMSDFYGPADEAESLQTIHAALDAGVNILDTGDFYAMGHNEMLLARVLKTRRKEAFVCVKFGAMRTPDGGFIGLDMRPAAVKNLPRGSVVGERYPSEQMAWLDSEKASG